MDMLGVWHYLIVTMGLYYIAPCVCVCGSDLYPRREAHSGNVTRRCCTCRRSRTSEATGLGYRHAYLEFVCEALNLEYIDASSNAGMFEESIIGVEWFIL